jgi:hypothetical protein
MVRFDSCSNLQIEKDQRTQASATHPPLFMIALHLHVESFFFFLKSHNCLITFLLGYGWPRLEFLSSTSFLYNTVFFTLPTLMDHSLFNICNTFHLPSLVALAILPLAVLHLLAPLALAATLLVLCAAAARILASHCWLCRELACRGPDGRRGSQSRRGNDAEDLSTNLPSRVLGTVDIDISTTRNNTCGKQGNGRTTSIIDNTGLV